MIPSGTSVKASRNDRSGKVLVLLVQRPKVDSLERPQQVARREYRGRRAECDHSADASAMRRAGTSTSEMNADIPGSSHAGEKREACHRRVDRHLLREAAEAVYLAMMRAIVDHADQDKEHRRDRPVIEQSAARRR